MEEYTPYTKHKLRRLRVLQILQRADGEICGQLILQILQDDPDLDPDRAKVLLSLIWLEDRGFANVRTGETSDGPVAMACITQMGKAFLLGRYESFPGIAHPDDFIRQEDDRHG